MRDGEAEMWIEGERVTVTAGQSLLVPPAASTASCSALSSAAHHPCWRPDFRDAAGRESQYDPAVFPVERTDLALSPSSSRNPSRFSVMMGIEIRKSGFSPSSAEARCMLFDMSDVTMLCSSTARGGGGDELVDAGDRRP